MSIKARLNTDMKQAMKDRQQRTLTCIRMLKSKLLEREVELRTKEGKDYEITDQEALSVISTYAKQRRDSIVSYREGGREELAVEEEAELGIVGRYLPKQLSEDQLRSLIQAAITESGASTVKHLGSVMQLVAPKTKGLADGKLVNRLVREMLTPRSE